MANPKDRTDVVAQLIAAEAIALALAKRAIAGMSESERRALSDEVTAITDLICQEIAAQAPAIGRAKGLSTDAANAAAGRIGSEARAMVAAHLEGLAEALRAPAGVAKH